MKTLLLLMNLILTSAALLLTTQLGKPVGPPPLEQAPEAEVDAGDVKPNRGDAQTVRISSAYATAIQQKNLFEPGRGVKEPVEPGDADGPADQEDPEAEEFELVGICRIGKRLCAVITVRPPQPTRTGTVRRYSGRSRRPLRPPVRPTTPAKDQPKPRTGVYETGEKIRGSAYTLAEIHEAELEILIRKEIEGEEPDEKIIKLNREDDASTERNALAAKQAEAEKRKTEAAARAAAARQRTTKTNTASPPPPPPPPPPIPVPAAAASGSDSSAAEARAKRLEELKQKRLEYLRNLKKRRTTSPDTK